jgi:hypothetical protein
MAEAPEHVFLSHRFIEVLSEFSRLKLYGYTEADRKRFDFACVLQRDWNRPLVGQTLWKHSEGIDKDVRTMLSDTDADIWAYVARDNVKNRATLHEVVRDFRYTKYRDELFRLRVIWIPEDFDADKEDDRVTVGDVLKASVVQDILFNVVFGNLSTDDIRFFLNATGRIGLNLAVLHHVAIQGFVNYPDLSKRLEVSAGPLRERILNLVGSGLLWQVGGSSVYFVSLKGRVFLELLHRISTELRTGSFSGELHYILAKLGLHPILPNNGVLPWSGQSDEPKARFARLVRQMADASEQWGIDLSLREYQINREETNPINRIIR